MAHAIFRNVKFAEFHDHGKYIETSTNMPSYSIIGLIIERTCVQSVYEQEQLRAPFTATLLLNLIMWCVFNSCSFNYKSDYSGLVIPKKIGFII